MKHLHALRGYGIILILAMAAGIVTSCSSTNPQSPNILLILVDDMGYGDAQCYNEESKIPTPTINRLADEGIRFTDAHATGPLCHMSRY